MYFTNSIALAAMLCASTINAHLALTWPLPFRAKENPNSVESQIDYSITSPLAASGANFPCKYNDMGTAGGKSVVTWQAGATANWTVGTGALHGGGSCQVALSYDSGKTFNVIHSYIGSCPTAVSSSASFTVPADAPTGAAMFAWTWQNLEGNREFYMSCASVTIEGGSKTRAAPAVAFSERPSLFLVNLGNGCTSVEGKSVNYPAPGPDADVTRVSSDEGSFTGTCGPVNGVVSSNSADSAASAPEAVSSASSSSSASTEISSVAAPSSSSASASTKYSSSGPIAITIIPSASSVYKPSEPASKPTPSASSASATAQSASKASPSSSSASKSASSASTPASTSTPSTSLTITTDGSCGSGKTCKGSTWGPCCSSSGFCGIGDAWCSAASCQPAFGTCGTFLNSTSSAASVLKGAGTTLATSLVASTSVVEVQPSFKPTVASGAAVSASATQEDVVVVTETVFAKKMIRGGRWW